MKKNKAIEPGTRIRITNYGFRGTYNGVSGTVAPVPEGRMGDYTYVIPDEDRGGMYNGMLLLETDEFVITDTVTENGLRMPRYRDLL